MLTAAAFVALATIFIVAAGVNNTAIATTTSTRSASFSDQAAASLDIEPRAPMAVSGQNVYVVWWTNKSENWEVMFRASNDGGRTFGEPINLSNSTDAESKNAEIVVSRTGVYVSWWESNPLIGSNESVLRVSTDNGQTFGPVVMLGRNGTITTTAAKSTTTGIYAHHIQ